MITAAKLSQLDIEALIPHAGKMCLLEQVLSYSNDDIICRTQSHLYADNPLKIAGKLSKMHLIEYGAQAIAIHGGLLENPTFNNQPRPGYIASVKSVKWGDFIANTDYLEIQAQALLRDDISKLYQFSISDAQSNTVCSARVMVVHPENTINTLD